MSRVITDSGFFHAMNAERSDEMAVFRIERTRDYLKARLKLKPNQVCDVYEIDAAAGE